MLKPGPIGRSVTRGVLFATMLTGPAGAQHTRPRDHALYEAARQSDISDDDLFQIGANVNAVVPGDGTPLMAAVRGGRLETVMALLDRGADPNIPVSGDGTALIV